MPICLVTGHQLIHWDGYYEHCRCGACAGDRRDPVTGQRYTRFAEWSTS